MKIHFYCSSVAGAGYQIGQFGPDGHVVKSQYPSPAMTYFNMGGLRSVLARKDSQLLLVLRQIEPEDERLYRRDRTGAKIYINLAFIAQDTEEKTVRNLLLSSINNRYEFTTVLYKAYQEAASGEPGYDFDSEKLAKLIASASNMAEGQPETLMEKPQAKYGRMKTKEAVSFLASHRLPKEDGVFFAATDMSENEYGMMMRDLPWYVISDSLEAVRHDKQNKTKRYDAPKRGDAPALFDISMLTELAKRVDKNKLLEVMKRFFQDKDGKFDARKAGITTGAIVSGILTVCLLAALLSPPKPSDDDLKPENTAVFTVAPTEPAATPVITQTPEPIAAEIPAETNKPLPTDEPQRADVWAYEEMPDGYFKARYKLSGNGVQLAECMSDLKTLYIPAFTADGREVVGIAGNAFSGCALLEKLVIGENVRFISYSAVDDWNKICISAEENSYAWRFALDHGILDNRDGTDDAAEQSQESEPEQAEAADKNDSGMISEAETDEEPKEAEEELKEAEEDF